MEEDRIVGLDLLRILAMLFVTILHVNGYAFLTAADALNGSGLLAYRILEAIAYPAIHLFVFISAYFLVDKTFSTSRITSLWLRTAIVIALGLIGLFIAGENVGLTTVLTLAFPVIGRAYWFISYYILMLLLSPFINKLLKSLDLKGLLALTTVMLIITVILPTISPSWPGGGVFLFIILYLIAAVIKRVRKYDLIRIKASLLYAIHLLCVGLLTASVYTIETVSKSIALLQGKEYYFYDYSSILVVISGVSLFCLFLHVKSLSTRLIPVIKPLSKYSLYAYLVSMHPAIKECYVRWGVLGWMNTSNGIIYACEVIITSVLVYCVGVLIGFVLEKLVTAIHGRIEAISCIKRIIGKIDDSMNSEAFTHESQKQQKTKI